MSHVEALAAFLAICPILGGCPIVPEVLGEHIGDAGLFPIAGSTGHVYLGGRERRTLKAALVLRLPRGGDSAQKNRKTLQKIAEYVCMQNAKGVLPTLLGANALAVCVLGEGTLVAAGMRDARYQITVEMTYVTDS